MFLFTLTNASSNNYLHNHAFCGINVTCRGENCHKCRIVSFPAGELPVKYLIHKKPFKLLLFCACVKCTIIEKMLRGIMTGRLSIQQLAGKFGRQVFGTHILDGIYIGNQKGVLVISTIFYILSDPTIFILYSPIIHFSNSF